MAIPFLNNINLDDNQLQNAKLHVTSSVPSAEAGQIYYNSTANEVRYHNGTTWVSLVAGTGGTVTSVTSGNANTITIGGTATDPTVAANTAAVSNGSANLATGDQIYDFVIGLGYITGNETITLSGDVTGSGTTTIATTIASGAVESGMLNNNVISGQTELASGLASTDELLVSDAGTIKRMDVSVLETYMQNNLTFTNDTDTTYDLNVQAGAANTSVIRLAGSDATNDDVTISGTSTTVKVTESGNTITLDLQDDVTIANDLTVTGDLTVSGTTTTVNTETINLADNIITLNSNYSGSSPTENGGIEVERGTVDNAVLRWNETTDRWEFTNDGGTTYYNIPISSEYDNFNFNVQVGGTSQEVSDGGTVTFAQGGGLTVAISGNDTITYSHEDTSSASSADNSGLTVIQDLTVDTYGHVTAIGSQDITTAVVSEITNRQIALLVGNGSATSIDLVNSGATAPDVDHGLGTDSSQFMIQLIDASTGETVYADVTRGASGLVTLDFATAPSTNGIRVLIILVAGSI